MSYTVNAKGGKKGLAKDNNTKGRQGECRKFVVTNSIGPRIYTQCC